MLSWQPSASVETLAARARALGQVRAFFHERAVMEVDTPVLSHAAVSDPFIQPFVTSFGSNEQENNLCYFQSSPEYAMKRLLASGSGAIYQLGKVYRNSELGRLHNPEFTMLEWYRPGWNEVQLMDEVEDLVKSQLGPMKWKRVSYRELFQEYLELDPHQVGLEHLRESVRAKIDAPFDDDRRDTWLELAMSHLIEPQLQDPTFVFDFPASQAALAQVRKDENGSLVAMRFELYVEGLELANGYFELTESTEQERRFASDVEQRKALGFDCYPVDERLISALRSGIPSCSGVALGFDRLLMLKLGAQSISEVLPFDFTRA